MEDALAQITIVEVKGLVRKGLNPCCNGRCTRTQLDEEGFEIEDES